MRLRLTLALALLLLVTLSSTSHASHAVAPDDFVSVQAANPGRAQAGFPPVSAMGYQNADGMDYLPCTEIVLTQDETAAVSHVDGVWAPDTSGCLFFPYFATGTSIHFLDALSVHFDLAVPAIATDATFRAFVRKGAYQDIASWGTVWHQYRLYPDAFSTTDEDCDTYCVANYESFPDAPWAGWIEIPVPYSWFKAGTLEVSLRLWNAQVDAVELIAELPTAVRHRSWGLLKMRYR